VPPKGVFTSFFQRQPGRPWVEREVEITNGEARVEVPVGGEYSYRPGNMIGYWFADSGMVKVPDGSGR